MNYLRIALNNSQFPFKYEERQVPALIPGMDTANRAPAAFTGSAGNMDWNIPQVIHMENYLPTARGYQGITWTPVTVSLGNQNNYGYVNVTKSFESGNLGEWADQSPLYFSVVDINYPGCRYAKSMKVALGGGILVRSNARFTVIAGQVLHLETIDNGNVEYFLDFFDNALDTVETRVYAARWTNTSGQDLGFNGITVPAGATQCSIGLKVNALTYINEIRLIKHISAYGVINTPFSANSFITVGREFIPFAASKLTLALESSGFAGASISYNAVEPDSAVVGGNLYLYAGPVSQYKVTTSGFTSITYSFPAGVILGYGIEGMVSAANYLIFIIQGVVYWSTPTNPLDFTSYGSGYAVPQDLIGSVVAVKELLDGFVIYTATNAIYAVYTNIPNAPFRFSVIKDSAGSLAAASNIGGSRSAPYHILSTSGGLQYVTPTGAKSLAPEISAVVSGTSRLKLTSNTLDSLTTFKSLMLRSKVSVVADKYVVVSYGYTGLSYAAAFVLDLEFNRWGHLQLEHVAAIDCTPATSGYTSLFTLADSSNLLTLGLMHPSGIVYRAGINGFGAVFSEGNAVVLGPIRLVRGTKITVQEVEVSRIKASGFTVKLYEDSSSTTVQMTPDTLTDPERKNFYGRKTGESIEIMMTGIANMQNLVVGVTKHGN